MKMKDSGVEWIGEIPDGWEVIRLRFICDINTGNQDTQDNIPDGIYPFYVRSPIIERSNSYTFEGPSILMAGDGVGAGKVFHLVDGKYGCHQRVYALRNIKKIDLRLLFYYMQNLFANTLIMENAKSTVDSVRLPMIQNFHILVPPKETQQKIATYLDEKCSQIEQTIQNQQQVIEKLKAYKQSLITEAVTGKVKIQNGKVAGKYEQYKDSGVEWIGEIPSGWKIPKIQYIATISCGSTPSREKIEYWHNGTINWIKTGELQNNELSGVAEKITQKATEECHLQILPVDTVLIALYGQGKTRGMTALLKTPSTTNQACAALQITSKNITTNYLWHSLMGAYDAIRSSAEGSGQPNLNSDSIKKFYIAVPKNMNEQEEICMFIDKTCTSIDSAIEQKQKLIEKLTEYKKSLIYECVTGK